MEMPNVTNQASPEQHSCWWGRPQEKAPIEKAGAPDAERQTGQVGAI